MRRMKIFFFVLAFISTTFPKSSGIISSGVDTIYYSQYYGFDFYEKKACLSGDRDPSCYCHFKFVHLEYLGGYCILASGSGAGILYGKANLDSIKSGPPDSVWARYQQYADTIPNDSLESIIGNVYLIKSGIDPRDGFPEYAKIKILNIIFRNKPEYQVDLVFLWAWQMAGTKDLRTSGLDTFHLDSIPTLQGNLAWGRSMQHSPQILRVVGDRVRIPQEWLGKAITIKAFDAQGKASQKPIIFKSGYICKPAGSSEDVWFVKLE